MMKKGDLVVLSAYGKKIKLIRRFRDDIGIILQEAHSGQSMYVKWTKSGFWWVNRRDVKKVRAK